jgi:hypothetical protein
MEKYGIIAWTIPYEKRPVAYAPAFFGFIETKDQNPRITSAPKVN